MKSSKFFKMLLLAVLHEHAASHVSTGNQKVKQVMKHSPKSSSDRWLFTISARKNTWKTKKQTKTKQGTLIICDATNSHLSACQRTSVPDRTKNQSSQLLIQPFLLIWVLYLFIYLFIYYLASSTQILKPNKK